VREEEVTGLTEVRFWSFEGSRAGRGSGKGLQGRGEPHLVEKEKAIEKLPDVPEITNGMRSFGGVFSKSCAGVQVPPYRL